MIKLCLTFAAVAMLCAGCDSLINLIKDNQEQINQVIDKQVDSGRIGAANADDLKNLIKEDK